MAFYLVICFIVYFNDIKMGRNILINFQLKGILLLAATKKSKTGKKHEKITPMKLITVKMRYQV